MPIENKCNYVIGGNVNIFPQLISVRGGDWEQSLQVAVFEQTRILYEID